MGHRQTMGLFPGSFDPITNGHLDVIRRGAVLFDRLIVAIAINPAKRELFTSDERLAMTRQLVAEVCPSAEVDSYTGLTVDYARSVGATAILRGLRNATDLNYEIQLALTNRALADIETVFILTGEQYAFTSSSLIKQIAAGGEIDRLGRVLPPIVIDGLRRLKTHENDKMDSLRQDGYHD